MEGLFLTALDRYLHFFIIATSETSWGHFPLIPIYGHLRQLTDDYNECSASGSILAHNWINEGSKRTPAELLVCLMHQLKWSHEWRK